MNEDDIKYFDKYFEIFEKHHIIGCRKKEIQKDIEDMFSQANFKLCVGEKRLMISGYIFGIMYTVDPKSHFNNSKIQH